jgi:hypothetical protein
MPHYEFKMHLSGPRHQFGLFVEKEISLDLARNRTRFFGCAAPSLVTILTKLIITQDGDKYNNNNNNNNNNNKYLFYSKLLLEVGYVYYKIH